MTLTDSALLVGGIAIPTIILSYIAFAVVLAILVGLFAYYEYRKHKDRVLNRLLLEEIRKGLV